MEFIPLGDLLRQLVLALGAALALGNVAVFVRERRRAADESRPKPDMRIVAFNVVIGTVLAAWGLSSILAAR